MLSSYKINFQSLKKFKNSTSYYRKLQRRMKETSLQKLDSDKLLLSQYKIQESGRQRDLRKDTLESASDKKNINYYSCTEGTVPNTNDSNLNQPDLLMNDDTGSSGKYTECNNSDSESVENEEKYGECNKSDSETAENEENDNLSLIEDLRYWALNNDITLTAIHQLLNLLNRHNIGHLPRDGRTLLDTPRKITVVQMGNGQYWHNNFRSSLQNTLMCINNDDILAEEMNLIFNIDGLPLHNSSKKEFWPILCLIDNIKDMEPIVIGIYCGEGKPKLGDFLTPFVNEMKDILENGIEINNHKVRICIKCFVCDSPARAYIKGTVNFNHYHGCIKCTATGDYFKNERHMSFPRIYLPKRTNTGFRNRQDPDHHKEETPLEQLPIDMVEDFPVADSLHLIDLGIMKRCLTGWVYGTFNYSAKFSGHDINTISKYLLECNSSIPYEIHRAVRGLDCLKFWKGLEYRIFLLYIGPVILKNHLNSDIYNHFLIFFCAITICSCKTYFPFINVADELLKEYIEKYIDLYGEDSISSNVHNLCHLVDDVRKLGPLSTFSAYPFENKLYQIKRLLRTGKNPLVQAAKRIYEKSKIINKKGTSTDKLFPILMNEINRPHELPVCHKVFLKIELMNGFILSNANKDKWFMTKDRNIISLINVTYLHNDIFVYGRSIKRKNNFFERPIKSSYLNIYITDGELKEPNLFSLQNIKCKMVSMNYKSNLVFFPLLHTLDLCSERADLSK